MSDCDWLHICLGDICSSLLNGGTPDTSIARFWMGTIPWITGADFSNQSVVHIRRRITEEAVHRSATNIVNAGNIILVTRTGVGKIAIAPFDVAISQDITGVYFTDVVDVRFMYHCLQSHMEAFKKFNQGTSINGILKDDLLAYRIDLPPLPQQRKIAKILTTVDNLIEKTEALIAKYQAIKQGMMHDLFTRGVDEHGHLRPTYDEAPELYKESELGWIPKEWESATLDQVAEVNRGKFTARPRNDPKFYGGPLPFIQTGDITNNLGRYLTTYSQTLNRLGTTVSKGFPAGSILVTIAANIADTAILGIPMYLPDSIVGVVVGPTCVVRFVELAIRRRKHILDALAPQSAQKNINLEDLRPLNIPLPSRDEQQKIADIYESFDHQIARETAYVEKLRSEKTGLMQDLLTGKVRVKVDGEAEDV